MMKAILRHLYPVVFNVMYFQMNFLFVIGLFQLSRSLIILFELNKLVISILFMELHEIHDAESAVDNFEIINLSGSSSLIPILMLHVIYNCHLQLLLQINIQFFELFKILISY